MQALKKPDTILVVEDEPEVRRFLEMSLRCQGYTAHITADGEEALQFLARRGDGVSLVLLDIVMPGKDGIAILRQIRETYKDLPVVMLSGAFSTPTIVEAIRSGAHDFLPKPINHNDLACAIQKALASCSRATPEESIPLDSSGQSLVHGAWMRKMAAYLRQVGACDMPVLIQGETGSGKELVSKFLHMHSPRADRPFLKLNCAALPSELVESELFGFEKGAFTGAFKNKPGKFDLADHGTLMLDEIGDMDFKLQAKLLHVLQDQQFERLGGKEPVNVNVRVLAATHCDLEKGIAGGRFRADLYHRLNVIEVHVPPLRERLDEIPALCRMFLAKHAAPGMEPPELTRQLMDDLATYRWPGNVRELENAMRRFLVLRDPESLIQDLRSSARSREIVAMSGPGEPLKESLTKVGETQRMMESEVILGALNKTRWNRKQAAAMLGVDYKALLYKMKKLCLEDKEAGAPATGTETGETRPPRALVQTAEL